ncbi:MAG TPA: nucleotidyl transferase AbiEii/AbiGii toxin family protein [Candidatus Methylomirabilis sp.]
MGYPDESPDRIATRSMISAAEIQRTAGALRVEPTRVDLDYALGWVLRGLIAQPEVTTRWIFKGGTCLRKCYFEGYRFSEDLDFTLVQPVTLEEARTYVAAAARWAMDASGIDFLNRPLRAEAMPDGEDFGHVIRVYYRGSLPMADNPRSIQFHLSANEIVILPKEERVLTHPYSDAEELGALRLSCYSLAEMLAEKLRAVCGQRRHAIARDLYDIHEALRRGVSLNDALAILPTKCRFKDIALGGESLKKFETRIDGFRRDWQFNVIPLLAEPDRIPFEDAWKTARMAVAAAAALG